MIPELRSFFTPLKSLYIMSEHHVTEEDAAELDKKMKISEKSGLQHKEDVL